MSPNSYIGVVFRWHELRTSVPENRGWGAYARLVADNAVPAASDTRIGL